ncbi:ABC transporter ATP-binding protein [Salsipaludibacter albus]|uniref:ABC transporter ATP-binding protein n=1 Tax=Salsipaludibacter albus TaxID=2849650 RepID=UPI001EE44791|nr:ABC transporter ATP-binding protein [Salsipaludibacter albus]MBY5162453.1 ABC transporter ATP-binding protein [Salsipaludibacter albus]
MTSTTHPAIHTTGLTKHYDDVPALVDLDLEVRRGEVFGFLGPNGAGKTTTIRTLLDLIRPTAGSASILGLDTRADAVEIRRHIGYLPSDLAMYPNLTGKDLLTYFANLRGGVDWGHVDALATRLKADLGKKVGDLSSGNRQKVGIIQAFMSRPDLVLMDEPSTGLDPLVQQEFQTMMREVADDGRSVFLSSHTLSEVQRVADRVGIIRQGRLVDVEGVHDLRSKAIRRVELVFDAPVTAEEFAGVAGVRDTQVRDNAIMLSFDGHMEELLAVATGRHHLVDINSEEADLEEIFLAYYREDAVDGESREEAMA